MGKDAVVVLFLNSFDEQVFAIIKIIAPYWVDKIESEIINETLTKLMHEISEVEEVEFNDEDDHNHLAQVGYSVEDDFEVAKFNEVPNTEIEKVKEELGNFIKTYEEKEAQILDELNRVKEENSKVKEENSKMKEDMYKMKTLINTKLLL